MHRSSALIRISIKTHAYYISHTPDIRAYNVLYYLCTHSDGQAIKSQGPELTLRRQAGATKKDCQKAALLGGSGGMPPSGEFMYSEVDSKAI